MKIIYSAIICCLLSSCDVDFDNKPLLHRDPFGKDNVFDNQIIDTVYVPSFKSPEPLKPNEEPIPLGSTDIEILAYSATNSKLKLYANHKLIGVTSLSDKYKVYKFHADYNSLWIKSLKITYEIYPKIETIKFNNRILDHHDIYLDSLNHVFLIKF